MKPRKATGLVVAAGCSVLLAASAALAQQQQAAGSSAAKLSPEEVVRKVEAAGYTDVRDVEYDDGRWEAEGVDKNGKRVDLKIDPATGAVVLDED